MMELSPQRVEIEADGLVSELPLALRNLHLRLIVNERIKCSLNPRFEEDWNLKRAVDLVIGAGFEVTNAVVAKSGKITFDLIRIRSLPDTISANMTLLIVGLNPSPYSADHSIGYARPGNRFWPAALSAKIVSKNRDPIHALHVHGLGMTDLVRRVTRRAAELSQDELLSGFGRIERQIAWLRPKVVCFMGLSGWRAVANRNSVAGFQSKPLGGRPVYLMPNPSGLNAHSKLEDFVRHFQNIAEFSKQI